MFRLHPHNHVLASLVNNSDDEAHDASAKSGNGFSRDERREG